MFQINLLTLQYLVPALSAPALFTPGHLVPIVFTPEYFSLREDYANEPLTSLLLLLFWLSWQATNHFTASTVGGGMHLKVVCNPLQKQ